MDDSGRRGQQGGLPDESGEFEGRWETPITLLDSEMEDEIGVRVAVVGADGFKTHGESTLGVRKDLSSACEFCHHGIPCHSFASSKNSKLVDSNVYILSTFSKVGVRQRDSPW